MDISDPNTIMTSTCTNVPCKLDNFVILNHNTRTKFEIIDTRSNMAIINSSNIVRYSAIIASNIQFTVITNNEFCYQNDNEIIYRNLEKIVIIRDNKIINYDIDPSFKTGYIYWGKFMIFIYPDRIEYFPHHDTKKRRKAFIGYTEIKTDLVSDKYMILTNRINVLVFDTVDNNLFKKIYTHHINVGAWNIVNRGRNIVITFPDKVIIFRIRILGEIPYGEECIFCKNTRRVKKVILVPCGHSNLCKKCLDADRCTICNQKITSRVTCQF